MNPEHLFDLLGEGSGGGGFPGGGGGLFSQMFNPMGGGGRRRPRKGESSVQPLHVTLEDLYKGKTSKLQLTKKVLCATCNGRGGKEGAVSTCEQCRGSGRRFITRQIGPGMIQQMQAQCDVCNGEGEIINEKDRCRKCAGRKTVEQQKVIQVNVTPGMRDEQKIVFYGEGDQEPGIEPGDVILVLKTKPHETFERKGNDLFIRRKISLKEALCSYTTVIKHLDGRVLALSSVPGQVIQPESVRGVYGEGMPVADSMERGNLYIIFDVDFPPNHFIREKDLKKLEQYLPPRPQIKVPVGEHVEEVSLSDFDERRYAHSMGGGAGREAYHEEAMESDEEEMAGHFPGAGAQHVQCAQQ